MAKQVFNLSNAYYIPKQLLNLISDKDINYYKHYLPIESLEINKLSTINWKQKEAYSTKSYLYQMGF